MPGTSVTLHRNDDRNVRQTAVLSEASIPVDALLGRRQSPLCVEPLSLSSVYRFLFLPLNAFDKGQVLSHNEELTRDFDGATMAPMGTMASYIERDLRAGTKSLMRQELQAEAERFADDVRICVAEIRAHLSVNRDAILRGEEVG